MTDNSSDEKIVCDDCETTPELFATPYRGSTQYVLKCDCAHREIDVSDSVSDSALVEAITGKWSNFNGDNPNL